LLLQKKEAFDVMLGEMIGELRYKSTGTRMINFKDDVAIEESFSGSGKILGVEVTDVRSVFVAGIQGEGQDMMMTNMDIQ
jgi:hypothetical protein